MPRRESRTLRLLLALDVLGWFCAMDGIRLALKTQRVNDVWGEIATRSDMLRQAIANQKALPLFSRKTGA